MLDPFLALLPLPSKPYYSILGNASRPYHHPWKRWFVRRIGAVISLDRVWKQERRI
jgi:hypothetical protein